jgi:HEAT repeat protein
MNWCGDVMDMSMEKPVVEWFNSFSGTGDIYRLIDTATAGMSRSERMGAVIALGESDDPRAVRPLVECCCNEDPEIRRYATQAFGKLRSGRAVDALIGRLKDKSELSATRQLAAAALAAIRSISAIEGLKDRLSDENEDPAIRSYVGEVLDRLSNR